MTLNRFPKYPTKPHRSGAARIAWRGTDYYLGLFGSPESHAEFDRLLAQFKAQAQSGVAPPLKIVADRTTVDHVVAAWLTHLKAEYGSGRVENDNYRNVLTALSRLYGDTPARDFDALTLGKFRDALVSGAWLDDKQKARRKKHKQPLGWSRRVVSRQIVRVGTMWRWAEQQGMVPRGSYAHLKTLSPIPKQSKRVRSLPHRGAVEWDEAKKVLPFVPRPVRAILELQNLTGLRPTEACKVKPGDVDRESVPGFWLLRIGEHKNDWRAEDGEEAEYLPLGPEAQKLLAPWIEEATAAGREFMFAPDQSRKLNRYDKNTLGQSVRRGCDRGKLPRFCPHQLRHTAKQRMTRVGGLDAARAVLRQKSIGATSGYARQTDIETAKKVMGQVG